jgi:hypothetical protein
MYDQMYHHPGLPPQLGGMQQPSPQLYAAAAAAASSSSSVGGGMVGGSNIMSSSHPPPPPGQMMMIPGYSPGMSSAQLAAVSQQQQQSQQQLMHESYIQPRLGRLPANRPIIKLSVGLIETYKKINVVSIKPMVLVGLMFRFLCDECCMSARISCCRRIVFRGEIL